MPCHVRRMYEDFHPKLSNLIPSFKSLLSTFLPNAAMADEKKVLRENFPFSPSAHPEPSFRLCYLSYIVFVLIPLISSFHFLANTSQLFSP